MSFNVDRAVPSTAVPSTRAPSADEPPGATEPDRKMGGAARRRGGDGWNNRHRGEGRMQRADRNFAELLQELRVTQTGVQILFAFLLGLAFTPRFATVTESQRDVYVATLVASAVTTALLIAPVAAHRLHFQNGRKVQLVRLVHRCLLAGLVSLLVTMTGAILLVLDVVLGLTTAVTVATTVAGWFVALWFLLPLCLHFPRRPPR